MKNSAYIKKIAHATERKQTIGLWPCGTAAVVSLAFIVGVTVSGDILSPPVCTLT